MRLPIHPIPMTTVFRRCFLANFAIDPEVLAARLPDYVVPDIYHGRALLSVVIADLYRMRPAFLPEALGVTYTQVVYRAVVRCGAERGVVFLRSDADNSLMVAAGNALTFFRLHPARASWCERENIVSFSLDSKSGERARIRAKYDIGNASDSLPSSSVFESLEVAESFLVELYSAFGNRRPGGRVEVVRINRTRWRSRVVQDREGVYEAMSSGLLFTFGEAKLDSVFEVQDLRYVWNRLDFIDPAGSAVNEAG